MLRAVNILRRRVEMNQTLTYKAYLSFEAPQENEENEHCLAESWGCPNIHTKPLRKEVLSPPLLFPTLHRGPGQAVGISSAFFSLRWDNGSFSEEHFGPQDPSYLFPLWGCLSTRQLTWTGSLQRAVVTKAAEFLWMLRGFFIVSFFPARILWR